MPAGVPRVSAGLLRQRVKVIKPVYVVTATGGSQEIEPEIVRTSVPVSIEPVDVQFQSRETMAAGTVVADISHRVRMRRDDAIESRMRLEELESPKRKFEIVIRRLDPVAHELHLLCVERVA